MAALWKLPVIYLCENNQYGMGTSSSRSSSNDQYYTRGDVVPGLWIDGMDVLAVKKGFQFARQYALEHGPIVVEAATYRYHGHSMSDPGVSYRSRDEVSQMRSTRDPVERVRHILLEHKLVTEQEIKQIEKDIRKRVDSEAEEARKANELPIGELFTDIYRGDPPPIVRPVDFRKSVDSDYIAKQKVEDAGSPATKQQSNV
jgi:pyruvate dehydrogenase E1 component alpha subunit